MCAAKRDKEISLQMLAITFCSLAAGIITVNQLYGWMLELEFRARHCADILPSAGRLFSECTAHASIWSITWIMTVTLAVGSWTVFFVARSGSRHKAYADEPSAENFDRWTWLIAIFAGICSAIAVAQPLHHLLQLGLQLR